MRRNFIIAAILVCFAGALQAQNETQALRYSKYNPFGTARYAAQGGAIGALGGDLSAIQTNPAGLGFYRSSEFSFTPSFYWVNTQSDYLNTVSEDSRLRFNVGSLGYVSSKHSNRKSGLVGASFAFGYNTLVNFNSRSTMLGTNNHSTMLDESVWSANSNPDNLDQFYDQVFYDANLLPYDSVNGGVYWNDIQDGGYGQNQIRYLEQTGYIGEYSFSGAFNFSNLIYFGAAFGIHSVRFSEDIYHNESDPGNILANFDNFQFREFNSTRGVGYNFRFGMILRPLHLLRIGASFQIPTYYYLTDEKYTDAASTWDRNSGIPNATAYSPRGVYDYKLKTPMRANAHASVILFSVATVSVAYEFVDYSTARLDSYDKSLLDKNQNIKNDLQDAHNLRAGAEFRMQSAYFRGGIQYLMSPYVDTRNNTEEWIYSAGFGVRTKAAFFDLSYSRGNRTQVYSLYTPGGSAPETSYTSIDKVYANNLLITLGLKF